SFSPTSRPPFHSLSLHDALPIFSRSFYISIRLLPRALREPVALAYLLARTSDTIADSNAVPAEKRIELLDRFAAGIAGKNEVIGDRKSTRLNSSHVAISYAVFCL